MRRLLSTSRYLVVIAVAGSFVASLTLMIYGGLETVLAVVRTLSSGHLAPEDVRELAYYFIEVVDLFLLATVFYIIALGLYELFIDDSIPLPAWLVIHSLDDLKGKLVGVVIVVLGVLFLGQALSWDGESDILRYGTANALVIGALSYFLSRREKE